MMGEFGASVPESQMEAPSINGEVNGDCKRSDEPADIEIQDDSEISSKNGVPDDLEENSVKKNTNTTESDNCTSAPDSEVNISAVTIDSQISDDSKEKSRADGSRVMDTDEFTEKNDDSKEKENGMIVDSPSETEELNNSEIAPILNNTIKKDIKEITKENGDLNGKSKTTSIPITDEIEIIESDDDDDENREKNEGTGTSKPDIASTSSVTISRIEKKETERIENVEQIKKILSPNGSIGEKNMSKIQDDDTAVIIHSDSENEGDRKNVESCKVENIQSSTISNLDASSKRRMDEEAQDPLSDKDDCVVIEDDDKKDKDIGLRKSSRQRKSAVKVRDFSAFDDDIAEIVEDVGCGQPPLKRLRTSLDIAQIQPTNTQQIGQITIKDARSLMGPFIDNSGKTQSFQQQFIQSAGSKTGGSKESALVIIDSNTMFKGNMTPISNMQNSPKSGNSSFSAVPVGMISQGIYSANIRPTLTPINTPPKLTPVLPINTAQTQPISHQNLLPALTDDMFVLEAPSFIVPYIYEKPPAENLKEIVSKMGAALESIKRQIEENKKEENIEKNLKQSSAVHNVLKEDAKEELGKKEKQKKRKKGKNPDDSWEETDTSTDDEASDSESRTKVLIKEVKEDIVDTIKAHITPQDIIKETIISNTDGEKKTDNYFESPLGKFFVDIGINLVQEYVQTDLLRQQKRKRDRAGKASPEVQIAINSLKKNLETSRQRNEPFKFEMKRCEYCNFKSESALAMAHHYETPHMRQYLYKCNFCSFEIRTPHDILFHMEAMHNIKGRLEKAPAYHQCPNCPFEDNGKSKLARHTPVCIKKFRPETNLLPPLDWEAPAKIPRIKPRHGLVGTATAYQAMAAQAAAQKAALAQVASRAVVPNNNTTIMRSRGRPQTVTRLPNPGNTIIRNNQPLRPQIPAMVGMQPNNFQMAPSGHLIQLQMNKKNPGQQPSISITPLPRQPGTMPANQSTVQATTALPTAAKSAAGLKPGQNTVGGKASFVICEICDGYIKDLEQLRNHMQWMHKVKIHPKMIYNRPPLNCQKCQFRFFTDQGLERHLLGSHGLVTSSMQEAANKGKDAGRCPVCGRMYQWKLLNHVSRDHHMTLKPAHLSYKCTVCTATFGMYKQFENHVYTAHSTVAKKAMDTKKGSSSSSSMGPGSNSSGMSSSKTTGMSSLTSGDSLLKPLKINDEITIIPQPATKTRGAANDYSNHVIGKW